MENLERLGKIYFALSNAILSFVIFKTLNLVKKENINSYQDLLCKLLRTQKGFWFTSIFLIITLFLGVSFIVMVVGTGTFLFQEFKIPRWIGCVILCTASLIVLKNKTNGLAKLNEIGIPILIILIILLGLMNKSQISSEQNVENSQIKGAINAVLYASYNSLVLIPILVDLKKYAKNKANCLKISILSGIVFFVLGGIILIQLSKLENIEQLEIPLINSAQSISKKFSIVYGCAILIAMFTSAVSALFGFAQNISQNNNTRIVWCISLCLISVLLNDVGFRKLMNILYPIFGYLGASQIIFLIRPLKN